MHLSTAELARLELMFASGQVRSDPPTLSDTDRMMDAMMHAANMKDKAHRDAQGIARDRQAGERIACETARDPEANHRQAADREGGKVPRDSTVAGELRVNWNTPRTLEELIQIRRALMRNEEPNL
jgi:hypothetical protein